MKRLATALAMLALAASAGAQVPATAPQGSTTGVEVDPIRCWWRTSAGGVRIGEVFDLSLTCATLENDAVQVVPDQSHLDPAVAAMAPFDVLGGSHPADLRAGQRRFFQYHYRLRIISPDAIGQDVRLPEMSIHYKVNSRIAANMSLQGRDLVYFLPPQSIRVASLVPLDASDIRDQSGEHFALVDALRLRAGTLDIAAMAAAALGALVTLLVGVSVVRRSARRAPAGERLAGPRAVAAAAAGELSLVQRARATEGWTDALADRALSATRIAAATAIAQAVSQRRVRRTAEVGPGRVKTRAPIGRHVRVFWSAATASDVDRAIRSAAADDARRVHALEGLRDALATFSSLRYGRDVRADDHALDEALSSAVDGAAWVKADRSWLKTVARRFNRSPATDDDLAR